jgi:hypothetical protein
MRGLFFNRSTTAGVADFVDDGSDEGRHGHQGRALTVHLLQQRLPLGIDEIEVGEIEYGFAVPGSGLGSPPALAELIDPRAREPAFQLEAKFAGAVVQSDL